MLIFYCQTMKDIDTNIIVLINWIVNVGTGGTVLFVGQKHLQICKVFSKFICLSTLQELKHSVAHTLVSRGICVDQTSPTILTMERRPSRAKY